MCLIYRNWDYLGNFFVSKTDIMERKYSHNSLTQTVLPPLYAKSVPITIKNIIEKLVIAAIPFFVFSFYVLKFSFKIFSTNGRILICFYFSGALRLIWVEEIENWINFSHSSTDVNDRFFVIIYLFILYFIDCLKVK